MEGSAENRDVIPWKDFEKCFSFKRRKDVKIFEVDCRECPQQAPSISCSFTSSANLKSHLSRKHKWSDEKLQAEFGSAKKKRLLNSQGASSSIQVTQQEVYDATDELIIYEGLSFSLVDSIYYKRVAEMGLPANLTVGCRQALVTRMDERFDNMNHVLKTILSTVDHVATTADCWSKHRRSFLGMTIHWIDVESMQRRSAALALRRVTGRHTGDMLAERIAQVHREFDIESKVRRCTTDSASNFRKAFKDHGVDDSMLDDLEDSLTEEVMNIEGDIFDVDENLRERSNYDIVLPPHQRCASHILNLIAVTDGPKAHRPQSSAIIHKLDETLKTWWRQQSRSTVVAETLKAGLGVYFKTPVKTCWNSEFYAKSQVCELYDKDTEKFSSTIEVAGLPELQKEELLFLREYVWVTKPLAYALNMLQKEKYTYLGYLLPTVYGLIRALEGKRTFNGRPLRYCLPLVDEMLAAIKEDRRFGVMMAQKDLIVAACLIPAFKLSWEGVDGERQEMHQNLLALMKKQDVAKPQTPEFELDEVDDDDIFLGLSLGSTRAGTGEESAEEELNRFLSLPTTTGVEECFGKQNGKPFCRLKQLFLHYNTALPSSASVERLFSLVGSVFRPGRAKLSDKKLEQQSLLSANSDIM